MVFIRFCQFIFLGNTGFIRFCQRKMFDIWTYPILSSDSIILIITYLISFPLKKTFRVARYVQQIIQGVSAGSKDHNGIHFSAT